MTPISDVLPQARRIDKLYKVVNVDLVRPGLWGRTFLIQRLHTQRRLAAVHVAPEEDTPWIGHLLDDLTLLALHRYSSVGFVEYYHIWTYNPRFYSLIRYIAR
jgi:hypothetical protein